MEISAFAAQYARFHFDSNVFCGDLNEAGFQDASFDVVTMWDALEHFHEPLRVLREGQRIIGPGGILAISMPDVGSWFTRVWRRNWRLLTPSSHLHLFSAESLKSALVRCRLLGIVCVSHPGRWTSFEQAVLHGLPQSLSKSMQRRILAIIRRLNIPPLYIPLGDVMLLCARKGG
ncbi:MAG: hypothetical protein CMM74_14030 [Rhodospirillaceae bacterium]|nr:hypothetical protein [Rhodospirillaceae bacterium]